MKPLSVAILLAFQWKRHICQSLSNTPAYTSTQKRATSPLFASLPPRGFSPGLDGKGLYQYLPLSRAPSLSSSSLPTTTSETPLSSNPPHEVIAHCSSLGGDIIRIRIGPEEEGDHESDNSSGYLTAMGVPTFAVLPSHLQTTQTNESLFPNFETNNNKDGPIPKRLGLEGIIHNSNAFLLRNALSKETCESILNLCENELKFGHYNAGKNNHGAMQIVITNEIADEFLRVIGPHVDLEGVADSARQLSGAMGQAMGGGDKYSYSVAGINRRFRIYRYAPNQNEKFAPHIDAGFPPGGVSLDVDSNIEHTAEKGSTNPYLLWDSSHLYSDSGEVVSRLTVLLYLNDDFSGGHTKFYSPMSEDGSKEWNNGENEYSDVFFRDKVIASIRPQAGSILVFPQAISESAVEMARYIWPLHEGSPVTSGNRPKYVIRTDVLFETIEDNDTSSDKLPEEERVLFQHDRAVRKAFLPTSSLFSPTFLRHVQPLYNPHMGVENVGPLLYSLIRFTKSRKIVEVGAGYTTLFLLQALKDNNEEMQRVVDLNNDGRLRLLDYPFGTPDLKEWSSSLATPKSSSLLCIDNLKHQKQTASSAIQVARTLGLDSYLQFLEGDAFDALDTHFSQKESIDLLWCDFGVGSKMAAYVSSVWKYINPGGFLVCHSTLTNTRTRQWLEGVRTKQGVEVTGIPPGECVEVSMLEAHKRFQNSVTILQKRIGENGKIFEEPIYSEYA